MENLAKFLFVDFVVGGDLYTLDWMLKTNWETLVGIDKKKSPRENCLFLAKGTENWQIAKKRNLLLAKTTLMQPLQPRINSGYIFFSKG